MARIVVLGGLVMDLIFDVPEWPERKTAVQATRFIMQPGGKGLNQSIAAARLDAQVSTICNVGQDFLGDMLISQLDKEGVDYQFVGRMPAADTDATCVIIKDGEPGFIGAKIATQTLQPKDIRKAEIYIRNSDVIIATGEIPPKTIQSTFRLAQKHKVTTILNPAPPDDFVLDNKTFSLTDYLIPNLWEASVIVDDPTSRGINVIEVAESLLELGAKNVILTDGERGGWSHINGKFSRNEPFSAHVVDATGASDAFCAAFAVGLANGLTPEKALIAASAAGAIACRIFGASTSMPKKADVNNLLLRNSYNFKL